MGYWYSTTGSTTPVIGTLDFRNQACCRNAIPTPNNDGREYDSYGPKADSPYLTLLMIVSSPLSTLTSAAFALTAFSMLLSKSSLARNTASTQTIGMSQYWYLNSSYTAGILALSA